MDPLLKFYTFLTCKKGDSAPVPFVPGMDFHHLEAPYLTIF